MSIQMRLFIGTLNGVAFD